MHDDAWLAFSEHVSCEDHCHLDCEPAGLPLSATQAQHLAERNANTLSILAALEERRVELADDDSPVMQEMLRLDAKLTALLDMVNRLLTPNGALPQRRWLRFNALGAVLPSVVLPEADSVLLRLRFDTCSSLPLELPARALRRFDDGNTFLMFEQLGDGVSASLERLVFRHHRRKVAGNRHSGS